MKNLFKSIVVFGLAFAFAATTNAAILGSGADYTMNSRESVQENLYVGAGAITIAGPVFGDAHLGGGMVLITGVISKDATIVGGQINIHERVGEDLRAVGGSVMVGGDVGQDAVIIGGTITILPDVSILGDAILTGGLIVVHGNIQKDLIVSGGEVVINGIINGDVKVNAGEKFTLGEDASIRGNLEYTAGEEVEIPAGVVSGEVTYTSSAKTFKGEDGAWAAVTAFIGIIFLIILASAFLAYWIAPNMSQAIADAATRNFWKNLGWGLVSVILVPLLIIFSLVTIIGIPFGMFWLFAYLMVSSLTKVFSGIVFGVLLVKLFKKMDYVVLSWKTVLLGALSFHILVFVPVVGWILGLVMFIVVHGTIAQLLRDKIWTRR
ncbi:hypothetical protein COB55_00380 [Candidatus Wolfebacteria bacterium]|nr:MAG: hypothetical protein COB55_00380 [Candidatus Wolfebacteria bacterium]